MVSSTTVGKVRVDQGMSIITKQVLYQLSYPGRKFDECFGIAVDYAKLPAIFPTWLRYILRDQRTGV
jgi:hypothetical protein